MSQNKIATLANKSAILALKFYRAGPGRLLPRMCRFHPTCSAYALGAFQRFGIRRGAWLTLLRLLRCQPLCKGGFDELPDN